MTKRAISNMVLGSKTESKSQQISDEEHDLHTDSVEAENVGSCEDDEWMDDARSETGSQSPHHMVAGSSTPFCEDVEVEVRVHDQCIVACITSHTWCFIVKTHGEHRTKQHQWFADVRKAQSSCQCATKP